MATITVEEYKGAKRVTLTSDQARMFEDEMRRVRGGFFSQLLARLFAAKVRRFPTAPDCLVKVDDNGRVTVYEIHSRYFVRKTGEVVYRPFYMGFLLLEWLFK
jgi:hypothetical protein